MWTPKNLSNNNFEEAIQKAMKEFKISRKRATLELTVFMCGNGDIEDFRAFINYLIINQNKRITEEKSDIIK
ncbi:MAG: hypothetical protein ACFFDH_03375 [Promethearchaeota archaeon]